MSMNKMFSIIIPVYNGAGVVERALDSIYSQGLLQEELEVICVDDCSPTMETYEALNNYMYAGRHPENLLVVRHEVNKRQGGARNTALQYATGKWILYLDQDDKFMPNALCPLLREATKYSNCDILMFDYVLISNTKRVPYANTFRTEVIPGTKFIQKYPIPWTPWCYAYKRNFLQHHGIRFEEYVRFEDVDYVIKCTLLADNVVFLPIEVYCHIDSGVNTSIVGNDKTRIEDLFKISIRLKDVALSFKSVDANASQAAMNHHLYHYKWLLTNIVWRLSYREIVELLTKYHPYELSDDKIIKFTSGNPWLYALISQIARPFLLALLWMRTKMLRTSKS